jgi:pimeloyl-ACP methyl ester carboxylesterase
MDCTEKLVMTVAEDGVVLEGAVFAPAGGQAGGISIVWMHGLASHYYTPPIVTLGRAVAALGHTFVATNNRGHDFGAMLYTPQGKMMLGGSGWEAFSESPRDVAAWVGYGARIGKGKVALAGHSLGALKVGYYLGGRADERVAGLIVASAPCTAQRHDPERVKLAEQMVAEGKGAALMPAGTSQAGAGTVSAQTLVDRAHTGIDAYGFDTPGAPITRVTCPILAFYGTKEMAVGGPEALATIERNATAAARVETLMVEGADHSYYGHEQEIAKLLARWVGGLSA